MRRASCAAVLVLFLTGCFAFNNPYENGVPTVQFQIVLASMQYGGTYVWNPVDRAYEATVGGTPYYVYMDPEGYWCLANALGKDHYSGAIVYSNYISPSNCPALPPTNASDWNNASILTSVDNSSGGVSVAGSLPSQAAAVGNTLQVAFKSSSPLSTVTYQWQSASAQNGASQPLLGTGSTYRIGSSDSGHWISVIITPSDSTGLVKGTPVTSQSVKVP